MSTNTPADRSRPQPPGLQPNDRVETVAGTAFHWRHCGTVEQSNTEAVESTLVADLDEEHEPCELCGMQSAKALAEAATDEAVWEAMYGPDSPGTDVVLVTAGQQSNRHGHALDPDYDGEGDAPRCRLFANVERADISWKRKDRAVFPPGWLDVCGCCLFDLWRDRGLEALARALDVDPSIAGVQG